VSVSRSRLFRCSGARRSSVRGGGGGPVVLGGVALPALLDDGRHSLLVLSPVLLVELGRHAVGRAVGVGLVQQGLDGRQDGGHVVRGAPPVLKDVQADASVCVDVWMKHFADKSDCWWFVWILFGKTDCKLESPVFEWGFMWPEDDSVPQHDVVVSGGTADASRGVLLEPLEVTHQPSSCWSRHGSGVSNC